MKTTAELLNFFKHEYPSKSDRLSRVLAIQKFYESASSKDIMINLLKNIDAIPCRNDIYMLLTDLAFLEKDIGIFKLLLMKMQMESDVALLAGYLQELTFTDTRNKDATSPEIKLLLQFNMFGDHNLRSIEDITNQFSDLDSPTSEKLSTNSGPPCVLSRVTFD